MGNALTDARKAIDTKTPRLSSAASFEPRTLAELLRGTHEQIESCDLARMALLCAEGLPGTEDISVVKYLRILDAWVVRIRTTLTANDHKFDENRAKYQFSRAKFKMWLIAMVLQREFGVHYRRDRIGKTHAVMPDEVWYQDSRDFMLHGVLGRERSGTCASLPTLLASVARRLGLPVHLALTSLHMFCRWSDPATGENFNFDWNGDGVGTPPDDHYREWPVQWTEPMRLDNERRQIYLTPLTVSRMLAAMLSERAGCLEAHGRLDEAMTAWLQGDRLFPEHPGFMARADRICRQKKIYCLRGSGIQSDENTTISHVSACRVPQRAPRSSVQASWPFPCGVWWGIAPPQRPNEVAPLRSELLDNGAALLRREDAKPEPINVIIHPIVNSDAKLPFTYLRFPSTRRTDHVRPVQEGSAQSRPDYPFSRSVLSTEPIV